MTHYHDLDDLKLIPELKKLAPDEFKGFVALDSIVAKEGGAIPRKYRELMALAIACTTQCPYCLDVHTKGAKRAVDWKVHGQGTVGNLAGSAGCPRIERPYRAVEPRIRRRE